MLKLPETLLNNLSNLRSLYLYKIGVKGQSLELPGGFFKDVPRLEKLAIVDCNLVAIPDNLLCDIPNIQVSKQIMVLHIHEFLNQLSVN